MKRTIILSILLVTTALVKAQKSIDPKRIKLIEQQIEMEIPTEEKRWFLDRARVDAYEVEFSRDTFRVASMRCMLMSDFFENSDSEKADSTVSKNEDSLAVPAISKMDNITVVYEETARRYDQLITKYVHLSENKCPPEIKEKWLKSQKTWLSYRQEVQALYDLFYSHDAFEKIDKLVKMNKTRLLEVYGFYNRLASE